MTEDIRDLEHHHLRTEVVKEETLANKETITKGVTMIEETSVIRREIEIINENILERPTSTVINARHTDLGIKIKKV